jgi:dolichol-phosphate mannosyltransferase
MLDQKTDNNRLSVIVPAFNEAPTVVELLTRLCRVSCVCQIIVVDDGSTDDTLSLATQSFTDDSRFVIVSHDSNRGKSRAIRTGLDDVTCSHVIIQDADLEYDPNDIAKLWAVMQSGDADVVYGSRYMDKPALQKGRWIMQSGVRFLNFLVRVLYGVKLTDEATCYKMFRTKDLQAMNLQCERFEFCPEVTSKAAAGGLTIREVPVSYDARFPSAGKKLRFRDGLIAVWTTLRYAATSSRLFNSFGVSLSCAVICLGTWACTRMMVADREGGSDMAVSLVPRVDEFGEVLEGELQRQFRVVNNGPCRLVLGTARTSCGCTVVNFSKTVCQPGESIHVTATVKGEARGQGFSASFKIPCVCGDAHIELTGRMRGRFLPSLIVRPGWLSMIRGGEAVTLQLVQAPGSETSPTHVYCTNSSVVVKGVKHQQGSWLYAVEASNRKASPIKPLVSESASIIVETDSHSRPILRIPVTIRKGTGSVALGSQEKCRPNVFLTPF